MKKTKFRVGIVGAGLVGNIRAKSIKQCENSELVIIVDINKGVAKSAAMQFGCISSDNIRDLFNQELDILIISTPTKFHTNICIEAFEKNMHVLVEKPLSRYVDESILMVDTARKYNKKLKTGFNHRHLQNVQMAYSWVQKGEIGDLLNIRSRYGHGGRKNYEKEWQAFEDISGGGELLSQGVHILDLFHWFLGKFDVVVGMHQTAYYDVKPLEDNSFALLKTKNNQIASMHVSWTQWKNLFSFEIFGSKGIINIEGRGGSYGKQKVSLIKKPIEHGAPIIETVEFPDHNESWDSEWKIFIDSIIYDNEPIGNGDDGLEVSRLVWAIYDSIKEQKYIKVER
jgi:predicted dehydrogenase